MRIDMPFDKKVFCQGLQHKGTESRIVRGITYYKICTYKDLDELLGHSWHYWGINSADDFCYVVLDTVEYHLNRRKPLIQYVPDENGKPVLSKAPQGHALIFSFVRGEHIFFYWTHFDFNFLQIPWVKGQIRSHVLHVWVCSGGKKPAAARH